MKTMALRKMLPLALCMALPVWLAACGPAPISAPASGGSAVSGETSLPGAVSVSGGASVSHAVPESQETLMEITLTAGDTVLSGVLFDNETARAFDLPDRIPDAPERSRVYELGSLAYWDEGPSIAIIYNDDREQTVVPVTAIGKLTGDVSLFFDYDQGVRIEAAAAD